MGRQIRFFLCPSMQAAIESEARRVGVALVGNSLSTNDAIEFSTSSGTDSHQGRLWTGTSTTHYEMLSQAVKKNAFYDRDAGLWVKQASRQAFETYRAEMQKALTALVEKNRKYAVEVLGGRPVRDGG